MPIGTSVRLLAHVGAVVPLLADLLCGLAGAPEEEVVDARDQQNQYDYPSQPLPPTSR